MFFSQIKCVAIRPTRSLTGGSKQQPLHPHAQVTRCKLLMMTLHQKRMFLSPSGSYVFHTVCLLLRPSASAQAGRSVRNRVHASFALV